MKEDNNLVLYRKYRPQKFAEVIGQKHIVKTLTNSILANKISHAYLFAGPRGSGKTSIARIFAKALNCQNLQGFEPCDKCSSCLEIINSKSLDLIEIDAASHRGIEDIKELKEGIKFPPLKSKYKIFIIDECHQLSKDASNALLKTLEEPPPYVIFLLATTEVHKMIPTILSRCQRFDFKRLQLPEIIQKLEFILKKEGIKYEKSALPLIAINARGSFRDAESLLDQCITFAGQDKILTSQEIKELLGIANIEQIARFVDLLVSKKSKESILFLNNLIDDGIDLQEFTKTLIFYLRQLLLVKINPNFLTSPNFYSYFPEQTNITNQISVLSEKEIQEILKILVETENKIKYATIPQLPLELAIINITTRETS